MTSKWSETIPTVPSLDLSYDDLDKQEVIGTGGNADIYRTTVQTADGPISLALKEPQVSGTLDTKRVDRLRREAETWAGLDEHDHIVGVIDHGTIPIPWIAMEYMDKGHLGDCAGELPLDQALWTALVVTRAVHHAHRKGRRAS